MSVWRREALKYLPQYKELIEQTDTISALLSELWFEFKDAYRREPKDEPLIAGVYQYAAWCWQGSDFTGNHIDLITAVFGYFYEPLPKDLVMRRDMVRWLCLEEFEVFQGGRLRIILIVTSICRWSQSFGRQKPKVGFRIQNVVANWKNCRCNLPEIGESESACNLTMRCT